MKRFAVFFSLMIALSLSMAQGPVGNGSGSAAGGGGSGTVTSVSGGGGTITVASPTTTPVITCATATAAQLGCSSPDNSTIKATAGVYAVQTLNQNTTGYAAGLAGGAAGELPYQTGANATGFSAAGTAKQIAISGGTAAPTFIDFPDTKNFPAAICVGGSPGSGWSFGATSYANSGGAACRAGTNNLNGYVAITDTAATFAQFQVPIPADWDTGVDPYILVGLISVSDTTNGHTIIPQIQISCPTATNGTVTDDHAFATAHALTTITMGASAVANGFYTTSVQMNSTDMTGCVAGGFMIVQLGRSTDTATGIIGFEYANITWPRLLAVQAN